jgi:hypothetical protein
MRNYIQILSFVRVAHKIPINWSNISYSSTQHGLFVACSHKVPCNVVHWNWNTLNTHAPTIIRYLLEVSWICSSVVWEMPRSVQRDSNLEILHAIDGVEMVVKYTCENMFTFQKGFMCCTCMPDPTSLKARFTMMLDNNLHVSDQTCFDVANVVPSWPSITMVTQRLFSRFAWNFGRLLFVSQSCPLHPSSYALQKIGSCPLKRQLCE